MESKVKMVCECLDDAFLNETIRMKNGWKEFLEQSEKLFEVIWSCVLNFAQSWQIPLITCIGTGSDDYFPKKSCNDINSHYK